MATPARIRTNAKYEKKAYQNIRLRIRKDDPEISLDLLKTEAEKAGQSVNAYILQAIKDRMEK